MPALNQKEAEQVASYLDLPCVEPPSAEIALVFGARLQLLYAAADLLRRGVVSYIGLICARNEGSGRAHALLERLGDLGTPSERVILLDHPAGDVLESVVFALPRIASHIPLAHLKTVVVICEWYMARRVLMTLKRIFPRTVRYYLRSCEPEDLARTQWYLCAEGAERIVAERESIIQAAQRGYALEIEQQEDRAFA